MIFDLYEQICSDDAILPQNVILASHLSHLQEIKGNFQWSDMSLI